VWPRLGARRAIDGQKHLELVLVEEADVGALRDLGTVDLGAWVLATPALALAEGEDLKEKRAVLLGSISAAEWSRTITSR